MNYSILLDTDAYKASHFLQFVPNMTAMFSYIESRGGMYDETVFFGLQYILKTYLCKKVTPEMVDEAQEEYEMAGLPFNRKGWDYIANNLGGKIPVRIRSVKEGSVVPTKNVLVTIESTDVNVPWICGWIESMLLRIWYPISVATRSRHIKKIMKKFVDETSDNPDIINTRLHDFGARGTETYESSMIGGLAHLVNFIGSDTMAAIKPARKVYNHKGFLLCSIPASEHSTITSWGKDNEENAYENMLETFGNPNSEYKTDIFACVLDAYDIFNAIDNIVGKKLINKIKEYGTLMAIRPDSGNPLYMVMMTLDKLDRIFGSTINSKGYKVLNNVRVVQGDGVDEHSIEEILTYMKNAGYSIDNIVFGMGGALLQKLDRDTQKFALKCSAVKIDGVWHEVFKDPVTDRGKVSKKGILDLVKHHDGSYCTLTNGLQKELVGISKSELETKFENGELFNETDFNEIKTIANKSFEV